MTAFDPKRTLRANSFRHLGFAGAQIKLGRQPGPRCHLERWIVVPFRLKSTPVASGVPVCLNG
jgi:hypothetical protein